MPQVNEFSWINYTFLVFILFSLTFFIPLLYRSFSLKFLKLFYFFYFKFF